MEQIRGPSASQEGIQVQSMDLDEWQATALVAFHLGTVRGDNRHRLLNISTAVTVGPLTPESVVCGLRCASGHWKAWVPYLAVSSSEFGSGS